MTNNAFKSTKTVFSLNDLAYSEMIQPEKTYLSDNYHTVGKYVYVPLTLAVFILGIIYKGIG